MPYRGISRMIRINRQNQINRYIFYEVLTNKEHVDSKYTAKSCWLNKGTMCKKLVKVLTMIIKKRQNNGLTLK